MSQKRCSKTEKFKQNKIKCESAVTVGKTLHVFILKASDPNDINIKDKLLNVMSNTQLRSRFTKDEHPFLKSGVVFSNLDTLDICMLHKLVYYLCDLENKAPELEINLRTLKNNRNDIAHNTDLNKFTDLFTFRKIEELRVLFETIIKGIENLYVTNIDDKIKEINIELDNILENVEVEVGDLEIEPLLKDLQDIGKCPFKVKIEIKDYPAYCSELIPLLETLGKDITRETRVRFQVYKPFFDDVDLQFYDSQKYLSPLLDEESRCQLTWYRGNMSTEMISVLPPTMKQLYLRMRSDQIEHLNRQLPKLLDLWNLVLYLDLSENGNIYGLDTIDPSSLPMIDFKGVQLGIKLRACLTTVNIPWIVQVLQRLLQKHHCNTLEFYQTRLNSGKDIEKLLRTLHEADIHVTTWTRVQSDTQIDGKEEKRLSRLATSFYIKNLKFLKPW